MNLFDNFIMVDLSFSKYMSVTLTHEALCVNKDKLPEILYLVMLI